MDKCTRVGIIQKRPPNSSSKEKNAICSTNNKRVYRDTTTELRPIVACSSWRQRNTPYHGCSHRGIATNCRQQQQQWRGWNVYEASPATTSESSDSPATAAAMLMFALKGKYQKMWLTKSDRCLVFITLTVAMLCCMNQWLISVHSSTVWQPMKLRLLLDQFCPSVCRWQDGARPKKGEIYRPMVTMGSPQEVTAGLLRDPHLHSLAATTTTFSKLGAHNP